MMTSTKKLLLFLVLVVPLPGGALEASRPEVEQNLGSDLEATVTVACSECVGNVDSVVRGFRLQAGLRAQPLTAADLAADSVRVQSEQGGRRSTVISMKPVLRVPVSDGDFVYELTSRVSLDVDGSVVDEVAAAYFFCSQAKCMNISRELYWVRSGVARTVTERSGLQVFEINLPAFQRATGAR